MFSFFVILDPSTKLRAKKGSSDAAITFFQHRA